MTELAERLPATVAAAPTLVEGIQAALRDAIAQGSLPPGYRLREIPLAAHFECSTTPVREAIRKLEHEGLVKVYPRRGAEVTSFTTAEVDHLYEARLVLETYAARKAAERQPNQAELAPFLAILERQEARVSGGTSGPPVDAEIHQVVSELAGNPVIAELVVRATRQIEAVQSRLDAQVAGGQAHAYEAHRGLYDAIAKGDADAAERLMREHIEWAAQAVTATLKESQPG